MGHSSFSCNNLHASPNCLHYRLLQLNEECPHFPRAAELIAELSLEPHPEGGYYREIFRSPSLVSPADGRGPRAALTTIYFLLPQGSVSRWHRVASDEVWHLYEGGPLEVLELDPGCRDLSRHRLAGERTKAQAPVCTIAANRWQAARPLGGILAGRLHRRTRFRLRGLLDARRRCRVRRARAHELARPRLAHLAEDRGTVTGCGAADCCSRR